MQTYLSPQAEKFKELSPIDFAEPEYNLSDESLAQLNLDMVDFVNQRTGSEGISAVWINPYHRFANLVRSNEARYFPEVAELAGDAEDQTLFLAMVDTRPDARRVVHAATVFTFNDATPENDGSQTESGFYTVDALIENGNFKFPDFLDYYHKKGISPEECISIETNFRIGEKTEKIKGVSAADLSYLMFFKKLLSSGANEDQVGVFATINRASRISFDRVGFIYEPLMGREDFVTPESGFGVESLPVFLPAKQTLFTAIESLGIDIPQLSV